MSIPKIIHQTAYNKHKIDQKFLDNILELKRLNPEWEHRLYDDGDIRAFISKHFDESTMDCFNMISPAYGAVKADFFRYLVMYIEGGVYLDIKSTVTRKLDDVLKPNDSYLLSHWRNQPGQEFAGWGLHAGLEGAGEYQQWHIISSPKHAFLDAVITKVKSNIKNYDFLIDGVGWMGVLKLTGPIAYTEAIQKIENDHDHRKLDVQDLGFKYTILNRGEHTQKLSAVHYASLVVPIINKEGDQRAEYYHALAKKRHSDPRVQVIASAYIGHLTHTKVRLLTHHQTSLLYLFEQDRCVHGKPEDNTSCVDLQFRLSGEFISFFIEIGGIKINLGLNGEGYLVTGFDFLEEDMFPKFKMHPYESGSFSLSKLGMFLTAELGGRLICNRKTAHPWEAFHVE